MALRLCAGEAPDGCLELTVPKGNTSSFTFDKVFGPSASQVRGLRDAHSKRSSMQLLLCIPSAASTRHLSICLCTCSKITSLTAARVDHAYRRRDSDCKALSVQQ